MSVVSTTLEIERVSSPALAALAVGGAVAVASLIASVLRHMASSPDLVVAPRAGVPIGDLLPAAEARRAARQLVMPKATAAAQRDPVHAAKASLLRTLAATPYYTDATAEPHVKALADAATADEVHVANVRLVRHVERTHQAVVVRALTLACRRAATASGLGTAAVSHVAGGMVRVTAADANGRGIVTEIDVRPTGEIGMASEVINGAGTCHALLDVYERALEREGVRRRPPIRRDTGGVCQLSAAKDEVGRQQTARADAHRDAASRREDASRRRRLNAGAGTGRRTAGRNR